MFVSIIIPTYNSLPKLKRALLSIETVDYPVNLYEVVIVDDGSVDGTDSFICEYQKTTKLSVSYVYQENRGPAAARNLAINKARGDYLLSIDSDCYVDRNIIREYLKFFPAPKLAGVGGSVLPERRNLVANYLDYIGVWYPGVRDGEVVYLVTANAFFDKKAILDVGGFAEDFRYPGGEEPEMCFRLRSKGYHFIYEEKALVIHSHRTSVRGLVSMFKNHGIGCRICSYKSKSFIITDKTIRKDILGKSVARIAHNVYVKNDLYTSISYSILEYLRVLSYYYGYKYGKSRFANEVKTP